MNFAPVISRRRYCTEGENNDENERNRNRKTGVRPLAAHSPALGVKVVKTAISHARFVAVMPVAIAFALMTGGARHVVLQPVWFG